MKINRNCNFFLSARKRFYAEASVVANGNGNFEVCLDHRKLKTPLGNVFKVENEALALAVAQEFMAQKEHIMTSQMHLTGDLSYHIDTYPKLSQLNYLIEKPNI